MAPCVQCKPRNILIHEGKVLVVIVARDGERFRWRALTLPESRTESAAHTKSGLVVFAAVVVSKVRALSGTMSTGTVSSLAFGLPMLSRRACCRAIWCKAIVSSGCGDSVKNTADTIDRIVTGVAKTTSFQTVLLGDINASINICMASDH
jgi:hypothetical protein